MLTSVCRLSCSLSVSTGYMFSSWLILQPSPRSGFPQPILQMSTQRHGDLPEVTQLGRLFRYKIEKVVEFWNAPRSQVITGTMLGPSGTGEVPESTRILSSHAVGPSEPQGLSSTGPGPVPASPQQGHCGAGWLPRHTQALASAGSQVPADQSCTHTPT